jgi:hypothetical protein
LTRRVRNFRPDVLTALSLLACVAAAPPWARSYGDDWGIARHDFGARAPTVETENGKLSFGVDVTGPGQDVYPTGPAFRRGSHELN